MLFQQPEANTMQQPKARIIIKNAAAGDCPTLHTGRGFLPHVKKSTVLRPRLSQGTPAKQCAANASNASKAMRRKCKERKPASSTPHLPSSNAILANHSAPGMFQATALWHGATTLLFQAPALWDGKDAVVPSISFALQRELHGLLACTPAPCCTAAGSRKTELGLYAFLHLCAVLCLVLRSRPMLYRRRLARLS